MDILTAINTGLTLIILGFIVAVSRTMGKMEGRCSTRGTACDTRFTRAELDIRNSQKKSNLEGDVKVQDDLADEKRLLRIEYDITALTARLKK